MTSTSSNAVMILTYSYYECLKVDAFLLTYWLTLYRGLCCLLINDVANFLKNRAFSYPHYAI
jgi:hypothetical protein